MSIATPQIGTLLGAVDSDAVTDVSPFGAHYLRPLVRSANRLLTKEQPVFNLFWPEVVYGEDSLYPVEGIAPLYWVRILPPIPLGMRPGLSLLDVWLRMRVPTGYSVNVFVGSLARPFRQGVTPDAVIAGSSAFANNLIEDIPVLDASFDEVELWIQGVPSATSVSTATYGSPNTRSSVAGTYQLQSSGPNDTLLTLSAASWNTSAGGSSLAAGGAYVDFQNAAGGTAIVGGRTIVNVPGATQLMLEGGMTAHEIRVALDANEFRIYHLPQYAISNFGAHAVARTT